MLRRATPATRTAAAATETAKGIATASSRRRRGADSTNAARASESIEGCVIACLVFVGVVTYQTREDPAFTAAADAENPPKVGVL